MKQPFKLPELKCKRCGHGPWMPRANRLPKVCPRCKRNDWNTAPKGH